MDGYRGRKILNIYLAAKIKNARKKLDFNKVLPEQVTTEDPTSSAMNAQVIPEHVTTEDPISLAMNGQVQGLPEHVTTEDPTSSAMKAQGLPEHVTAEDPTSSAMKAQVLPKHVTTENPTPSDMNGQLQGLQEQVTAVDPTSSAMNDQGVPEKVTTKDPTLLNGQILPEQVKTVDQTSPAINGQVQNLNESPTDYTMQKPTHGMISVSKVQVYDDNTETSPLHPSPKDYAVLEVPSEEFRKSAQKLIQAALGLDLVQEDLSAANSSSITMGSTTHPLGDKNTHVLVAGPSRRNHSPQPKKKKSMNHHDYISYRDFVSDEEDIFLSSSSSVDEEKSSETTEKVGEKGLKKQKINQRKERKALKDQGKSYTKKDGTVVRSKSMQVNPCIGKKCGRSCGDIKEERRENLFKHFNSLDPARKKDWLIAMSEQGLKNRKRTSTVMSRRSNTFYYFINEGEGRRPVCQQFILNTLGISQRQVYYTLTNSALGSAKIDMRGKHIPANKTNPATHNAVMQFIKDLPAVPSHYCRKDSTKLYLPTELKNLSHLYRLYKSSFESQGKDFVGERVFRETFNKNFSLSFHVPRKDKCLKCQGQKNNPSETNKEAFEEHERQWKASDKRFKFHKSIHLKEPETLCVSFDMQKVLNTPYGESMLFYYTRKYSVYNLTFYESGTKEVYCYTWGESDGKRGGNEVATILNKYIKEVDTRGTVKNLILYSDSCCGQNRNKTVFTAVHHTLLKECTVLETIQMNFLIPGHTFMPVDSVHATIENSVKNTLIFSPTQWSTVFTLARREPRPYIVKTLTHDDFMGWEALTDKYFKNNLSGKIANLRIITFKKDSPNYVTLKSSMEPNASREKIDVTGKNGQPNKILYKNRLPISKAKHLDLSKLCSTNAIPKNFHVDYINLPYNNNIKDSTDEPSGEEIQTEDV